MKGLSGPQGALTHRLKPLLDEENDGDDNEEDGYNNKDNGSGEHNGETLVNEGLARQHLHSSYDLPAEKHNSESFMQLESALHLNSSSGKYSCAALSKSLGLSGKISASLLMEG